MVAAGLEAALAPSPANSGYFLTVTFTFAPAASVLPAFGDCLTTVPFLPFLA
jgi:hypothetical protein